MTVIKGSKWWAGQGEQFVVLDVITIEGYTWVHYRNDGKNPTTEYSCYLESFLQRFSPLP